MRFKEIEDEAIRESAITQYMQQIGINERNHVLNCYVSMLDYSNTIEGYDFWNKIRPLRHIPTVRGIAPQRIVLSPNDVPIKISDEFKNLLVLLGISIEEFAEISGYPLVSLEKVYSGEIGVGSHFIKDISFLFKIDTTFFTKKEIIKKGRKIDERPIPRGKKRTCTLCNKSKNLAKEYNKFKYGKYQKATICRTCFNEKYQGRKR